MRVVLKSNSTKQIKRHLNKLRENHYKIVRDSSDSYFYEFEIDIEPNSLKKLSIDLQYDLLLSGYLSSDERLVFFVVDGIEYL